MTENCRKKIDLGRAEGRKRELLALFPHRTRGDALAAELLQQDVLVRRCALATDLLARCALS